jgi:hypothetical protein
MPMADRSRLEFSGAELFGAFRRVMSARDARWMARLCSEGDRDNRGDYTHDTLILLSLQSPELEARVRTHLASVWAAPGGREAERMEHAPRETGSDVGVRRTLERR